MFVISCVQYFFLTLYVGIKVIHKCIELYRMPAFDSFSNADKELIIQYQAKYEKDIECGGGYLKIGPKMADQTKFGQRAIGNCFDGPDAHSFVHIYVCPCIN